MKQTLYSCKAEINGDGHTDYRISKFVDGDLESSYLTTLTECECPAGHRPSCRHRQMLPMMLAHSIVNTFWFWDFDLNRVVDFSGELKSNIDALNELAALPEGPPTVDTADAVGSTLGTPSLSISAQSAMKPAGNWRRI